MQDPRENAGNAPDAATGADEPEFVSLHIDASLPSGGFLHLSVWTNNGEVFHSYRTSAQRTRHDGVPYAGDTAQWLRRLAALRILDWEPSYGDRSMIGGIQWSLDYTAQDRPTVLSRGDNAFPQEWPAFIALLQEAVPESNLNEELGSNVSAGNPAP